MRRLGAIGNRSLGLFRAIRPTTLDGDHVFSRQEPAIYNLLAGAHPVKQVIAAPDADPGVDVVKVGLDGRDRTKQLASDVRVAFPLDNLEYDLALLLGDTVFRQERLENSVDLERGGNDVIQEIDNDEDALKDVGDGAVDRAVFRSESRYRGAHLMAEAGQSLSVTDGSEDQEADHGT